MTDLERFERVCYAFPARLLIVHAEDAPEALLRIADGLECLEGAERAAAQQGGWRGRSRCEANRLKEPPVWRHV
jgi:hypothetical protein